jgi:hypothetical protein
MRALIPLQPLMRDMVATAVSAGFSEHKAVQEVTHWITAIYALCPPPAAFVPPTVPGERMQLIQATRFMERGQSIWLGLAHSGRNGWVGGLAKPPKATSKPSQSLLIANRLRPQSHPKATPKPP